MKTNWMRFFIAFLSLFTLKLVWDVSRIPDYSGGYLELSHSPNGQYQVLEIGLPDAYPYGRWTHFALASGGFSTRVFVAVADAKTKRVVAYIPLADDWMPTGRGAIWQCGPDNQSACTSVTVGYDTEVVLPPSLWQRLVARLVVYFKDLENPKFKQIRDFPVPFRSPK